MDLGQMLMELLMAGGVSNHPKTSGPGFSSHPQNVPPPPGFQPAPPAQAGPPAMPPGMTPTQPLDLPPMAPPAPPLKLGTGQPQMADAGGFRGNAMGLFGRGGGGLARFFADAMAGASTAGGGPGAFAAGAHGAMSNYKNRNTSQTAAEREAEKFGWERTKSKTDNAKSLSEIVKNVNEPAEKAKTQWLDYLVAARKENPTATVAEIRKDYEAGLGMQNGGGASMPTFGPELEGKSVQGPDGKAYVIKNGVPVPLEEQNL